MLSSTLSPTASSQFFQQHRLRKVIDRLVMESLSADIGSGDVTANLLPKDQLADMIILARESGVMCGVDYVKAVFKQLDTSIAFHALLLDGDAFEAGQTLIELHGPVRTLLSGERVALNGLQTLSGTATTTRQMVDLLAGYHTQVLDTRKTIPGLRLLQKYAVLCGGGVNHRIGLHDMFLIKENHLLAMGSIEAAVEAARASHPHKPLIIEVENMKELSHAVTAGVDRVLLDNFTLDQVKRAVEQVAGEVPLEISGNVQCDDLLAYAATGVDYVSMGALTKHVRAMDFSMLISP